MTTTKIADPVTKKYDSQKHINNLLSLTPSVQDLFNIHEKVGEGTFSSVYLATLKSSGGTKQFALKHLVPTCHPERVKWELECLQQIGNVDYIVGLELCLRHYGSIVFVMPYMRHDKFSDYVQNMTVQETKDYMRALFTALRRVHSFNVIHRDIKPNNFLYDRQNRRYLLVDFGLAQKFPSNNLTNQSKSKEEIILSLKRKRKTENNSNILLGKTIKGQEEKCYCFGKPKLCSLCLVRPTETAPRAGTPGYRAPEVLLKHISQTSAIDIWASGIILLSILSGTQTFFRSPDDCTALAEITTVFGSTKMQQCARKLGKKLIISENIPEMDITMLCQKLRRRKKKCCNYSENSFEKDSECINFPKEAYDLLIKLLDLDYNTRLTAEGALNHPFLRC